MEKSYGVLFLYLTVVAFTSSETPSFPSFEVNFATQVEVTRIDPDSGNDTVTFIIHEYHDVKEQRGRMDQSDGSKFFYFQKLNQVVVVSSDKRCYGYKINKTDIDNFETGWGWWDPDDKLVGPSATLKRFKPTFEKNESVRGISCNKFVATDGNISLAFYMADQDWLDSSDIKHPVPVKVTFNGTVKFRGQDQPLIGQMDFIAFHFVDQLGIETLLKIPHGIGCQAKSTGKGVMTHPGKVFPKIKDDISYTVELLNIETNTEDRADTFVDLIKMWFHSRSHYVRVEGYDSDFVPYNEVQDYNTGVNYRVYRNDTCFLSAIQNKGTENHDKGFMGRMKSANEYLNMDADYYFLGMEDYRSINCEVWEAIIPNKTMGGTFYSNVLYTYYVAAPKIEVVSGNDANVQVPVALIISAFKADLGGEPDVRALYNFFNFDEANLHQLLREVDLSKCFEEESQKNYFIIRFQGNTDAEIKEIKRLRNSFELEVLSQLTAAAQASLVRFPVLQVHVENQDIVIFGLLLNRPPTLAGFLLYNDQGFTPTVDMDQVTSVDNPEQCADYCLRNDKYKCRIFSICNHPSTCESMQNCKFQCFLGKQDINGKQDIDSKFNKTLSGQLDCQLYARAVLEEVITELDLEDSLKALQKSIDEKRLRVDLSSEKLPKVLTATVLQTGLKPFNDFNHELLYETSFDGFQLKNSAGSFATQEVYEKIGTPELCYDRCLKDTRLSCASFSYCPNTGLCRLSTLYMTVDVTDSVNHIEIATACRVYRKRDFDFFEKTPGKIAKVRGKKALENVIDSESCAVWCKSDKQVSCKSYDYCSNTKSCVLHDIHHLDEPEMQPDQNEFCNHYNLKYSAEYTLSPGFQIVDDKQATIIHSISFEECAKRCSEDSAKCRSINFCPGSVEEPNVCALNTMAIYDPDVPIMVSDICQHYSSRINHADIKPIFVNIRNLVTNGYQATIEVTRKTSNKLTESYVVNEYHDLRHDRGRVVRMNLGGEKSASWFYFTQTKQVVNITGSNCRVESIADPNFYDETRFWKDIASDDFIAGPSGILYRETASEPVFDNDNTIRGIRCNKFSAIDKIDTKVNMNYYVPQSWNTVDDKPFPYPIRVEAYGTDNQGNKVDVLVDIHAFVPSIRAFDEFQIPVGIGCVGLKTTGGRIFPPVDDQFSYTAEVYNIYKSKDTLKNNVILYKIWFDAMNKVLMIDGVDETFLPFKSVADFSTGVQYTERQYSSCDIEGIKNSPGQGGFHGEVGFIKNGKSFLGFDGDYYYIGKGLVRSVYCDIWETVKKNVNIYGSYYYRLVQTVYLQSPEIQGVADDDFNIQVPVKIEMWLQSNATAPVTLMENNIFNFDEAEGRFFYNDINIERCFPREEDKDNFMVYFPAQGTTVDQFKTNLQRIEVDARLSIAEAAQISLLRISSLMVHSDKNNVVVLGTLLAKPPPLAAFYLFSATEVSFSNEVEVKTGINEAGDCATVCLSREACKGFTYCPGGAGKSIKCFLTYLDVGESGWGDFNRGDQRVCSLYFRSAMNTSMSEPDLKQAISNLDSNVKKGMVKLGIPIPGKETVYLVASKSEERLTPFNWLAKDLFDTVFTKRRLNIGSETVLDKQMTLSASECNHLCLEEDRMFCSSFSYCKHDGNCRLSSQYIDPDSPTSQKDVEEGTATACNVYRRGSIKFFDKKQGLTSKNSGDKFVSGTVSADQCALSCRQEKSFACKGFEFCDTTKDCVLHKTHSLDIALNPGNPICSHYSFKYSAEYTLSPGLQIIDDKQATIINSISFEECAKWCSEDSKKCRSINFCPASVELNNVCALSTMTIYDQNVPTIVSKICQHYSRPIKHANAKPIFVNIRNLVTNGYQATIEVTRKTFNKFTESYVVNEYHDLQRQRGRVDRMNLGGQNSVFWFYFTETKQVVNITGSNCRVESFEDPNFYDETRFWRYIASDDFIAGPSGILYRGTASEPIFDNENTIRGIACNKFSAFDKIDTKVKIAYFVPQSWKTVDDKPFPYPIRVEAYGTDNQGQNVDVVVDIHAFVPSIRAFDEFQIPVGIGCVGLKTTGGRKFPPVEDQFSYTAEVYNIYKSKDTLMNHVLLNKIWFDAMNKVLMIDGVDETFLPFKSVADFSTGVQYTERQYSSCDIEGIKNSPGQGGPDGEVRFMKNGNSFLGFDGDYYYIGKGLVRSVYCDIWETVKKNVNIYGSYYYRLVQTVYLQSPEIQGVADDDFNIQVPVKIEMWIQSNATAPVTIMKNNIFNFDEAEGRLFYNDINIERCFPREEDKDNFMVYFPAQGTTVDQRKANRQRIEVDARLSIAEAAQISLLRISSLMVHSDKNNVVVLGTLLAKPPPLAGFYLFSDKEESFSIEVEVKTGIKEPSDCASACLSREACKGFTYCPGGTGAPIKCFLTSLDVGDSGWRDTKSGDQRVCSLYFRSAMNTSMSEPDLKQAISNLDSNVKKGMVKLGIPIPGKETVYLVASKSEERLTPFNWEDKDLFDTVFTQRRLNSGSETVLAKQMALAASECNQLCLEEESMFCSSFSYCKHDGDCRLSSQYIDPNSPTSQEDVEEGTATACNVYRRGSINFFDKKQGLTSKNSGDKFVSGTVSADQCALSCRQEKSFACKGFEFCDTTKDCVLHKTHSLDIALNPGNPICSHYSLKYGLEFSDMGKFELVGPNKPTKTTVESFEQCSKLCYELGSGCLSFNYCPGDTLLTSSCSLLAADSDTSGYDLDPSETCSYYFRRSKAQVKRPVVIVFDDNRVSGGHFAGVTVGVLIFGMFLGAAGFILLSFYKSRHQNAGGISVRYVKST